MSPQVPLSAILNHSRGALHGLSFVVQVQADVAAIAMEEVLPSSVADAEALAPEELYNKKRGREAEFLEGEENYTLGGGDGGGLREPVVCRCGRREGESVREKSVRLRRCCFLAG